ncbi:adenine-specific DNA-methyltransferase [Proteiniborus ethanoligenes]|uniref:Adenine-specific DNA-methyltransferase n=1 Tax=Proteiniborus ethanoligenes TaxID=415015 RepID=A0A1H3L7P5_9FIRM|nr:site-specific DNA-methyltransferase [Proteiniborus ethanoligenes]SDY60411.1 adenine-specific DNA-methyltransferase [Proteiniborus ethanoligenes]
MKEINLSGETPDIAEENIQKLKQIFPDVFTEDKVDFEKLQQVLGEYVEHSKERYNFTWNGKGQALRLSQTPSLGTLRPCKEESKDWDTTQNLYIEGDNLEVLKLLQKSYHSKVKMIYIDPPYNTGKDFVYPDDFHDSLENYKKLTGQVDSEGNRLSTNTEASGRYHTDWLNMMYPRLRLARNLLADDGVIFISIDDNEVANLKKICDEIFGEDNFTGEIIRKTKSMTGDEGAGFNLQHENLIFYAKNKDNLVLNGEEKTFNNYTNPDNDPKGEWTSGDPSAKSGSESTYFEIINPFTNKADLPPKGRFWAFSKASLEKYIENGKIKFKKEYRDNERGFIFKRYKNELQSLFNPVNSLFPIENEYMNQVGTKEVQLILEGELFNNPKPVLFIEKLVKYSVSKNDIILDFFSGSATTAHAVMQLNAEDGGNRKFIMVQLPEPTDNPEFANICEIGKERIRRAGEKIKEENKDKENIANLDIGFKVLKLDTSNIRKWQPDYDNLEQSLLDYVDNYMEGRTELDVVYEIMLKYGLDLTYPVDEFTLAQKKVYSIGFGMLMICLDNEITIEVAKGILEKVKELAPESTRVVFKDNGFKTDSNKTNIKEILKSGGIEEFITI